MERNSPSQHEAMADDPFGRISISSSQGKLDFSAPLLSVRRHAAFDVVDEDLVARSGVGGNASVGLGSLRSPGTVPFIWEHSPGQPKAKEITLSVLPAIPAPPQGRASPAHIDRRSKNPDISTDQQRFRHVLSDHRDGRTGGEVPVGPFVPKALFQNQNSQGQTEQQTLAGVPGEKGSSLEADSAACNNSLEEGDAFSDAADTFNQNKDTSRASVNSTLHDLNNSVLPFGRTDPHARDFIMRRFLPAAKAMAVELPAAPLSLPESNIQKKIHHSTVGQLQRCPLPRPPVTDRLANLTDKRVVEDSYLDEDMESSALYRKACGLFPFRLNAAFKHLLPQSCPTRLKSKSKLHFVQFRRRSKAKNPAALKSTGKSSNKDESSESSSTEDEHDNGVNERYELQSYSERATFIGTGLMNRILQNPQQFPKSERKPKDHVYSYKNGSVSLPSNETKGFLGLPKDGALTLSKKQGYGPSKSLSAQSQKPSQTGNNARYCNSLAGKNNVFGSSSPSEMQLRCGKNLRKDSKLSSLHQSDLLKGDHSDESDSSTTSSDTSSLYGDGSPRATAETGETSTTDDKTDQSGNCDSNLYLHSEIAFSGVKGLSVARAQEAALPLESANHPISDSMFANELGGTNYQKLPAQASFEANSSQDLHRHNEQSHKNTPASILPPPLPKAPSQSWLWRASPSPASASLFGQETPQVKAPNVGISNAKSAKWEAMVKSGNTQPGHLRYSEVLMEDPERHLAIPSSCI